MIDDAPNRFQTVGEIFAYINQVFSDPDRKQTATRLYYKLYQNKRPFSEFWIEFQRLSTEPNLSQETMVQDLQYKLSYEPAGRLSLYTRDRRPRRARKELPTYGPTLKRQKLSQRTRSGTKDYP
jgi:hypothetical protein